MHLSLVIPCFNEEKRLEKGLTYALTYLKSQPYEWELVCVDDGSTDRTGHLIRLASQNNPIKLLTHKVNQGKGAAIRDGMMAAKGKYVLFSDIDFSTPLTELPRFLSLLKDHDIVIGVRRHPQSRIKKHQPLHRESLGQVFTKLTNLLVAPGIYDFTCGFKGFRKSVGQHLFSLMKTDRWVFDAEVLFLAQKFEFKIAQVPVVWADNSATKVHLVHDSMEALVDLLRIRWRNLRGEYGVGSGKVKD